MKKVARQARGTARVKIREIVLARHRGRLWMINQIGEAMAFDANAEARLARCLVRFFAREF